MISRARLESSRYDSPMKSSRASLTKQIYSKKKRPKILRRNRAIKKSVSQAKRTKWMKEFNLDTIR